jgi:hypothetical protein
MQEMLVLQGAITIHGGRKTRIRETVAVELDT